jgi:hypothetical protein
MPPIRRPVALLALCLGLCALTALAQSERKRSPWQSFGTFEISWPEPEGLRTIRMIHFSNGEFMAEVEAKGTWKRHLRVQPSSLVLYSGLSDDESPRAGAANNPFMFLDYGFAYPALALHQAYPSGANSVSEAGTDTQVLLENKHPATLTAVRASDNRIRFRLALKSEVSLTMDGVWDGRLRDPLPDDFRIASWRHESPASVVTLGEARALPREQVRSK